MVVCTAVEIECISIFRGLWGGSSGGSDGSRIVIITGIVARFAITVSSSGGGGVSGNVDVVTGTGIIGSGSTSEKLHLQLHLQHSIKWKSTYLPKLLERSSESRQSR